MRKQNITKTVEKYVQEHPSIKDCLKYGYINYSRLTRAVSKELSIQKKYFDAVLVALRRYERKIKGEKIGELRIKRILKDSKIELKNKVIDVILEKDISFDNLIDLQKEIRLAKGEAQVINGISGITIITTQDFLPTIEKYFKGRIIHVNSDLIELVLKTTKEIEETPGVISYLTALLSDNNINIIDTFSSYIDTIFVIHRNDAGKAIQLFTF